jgi:mycobactin lysine-N-oxygenase
MTRHLAVVGGGAKAAALAAKLEALEATGQTTGLKLTIIEKKHIGANWDGSQGLTSGLQRLVTEPERDVGFPYTEEGFGPRVPLHMLAVYSWQTYCVSSASTLRYHDWLDRGRPSPSNAEWARYLRWVVDRATSRSKAIGIMDHTEVTRVAARADRIQIHTTRNGHPGDFFCDGLVLTGPGPARRLDPPSPEHPRVVDAQSFWLDDLDGKDPELPFVVIGAGGAAANIIVELIERREAVTTPILVVSRDGAIYTRGGGYFERRYSSDPTHWRDLSAHARLELISRGELGVVTPDTLRKIYEAPGVDLTTVRSLQIQMNDDPGEPEAPLQVIGELDDGRTFRLPTDYVVEAIGFDAWWFVALMDGDLKRRCETFRDLLVNHRRMALAGGADRRGPTALAPEHDVQPDLSLPSQVTEGAVIHVPMVADLACGPGFPSLSSLGLVADRILERHILAVR